MPFPLPTPPLNLLPGRGPILLVAPHATAELQRAVPFVDADPAVQAELGERVAEWHDAGSGEAMAAAAEHLQAPGLAPILPRGLMDLNRGWKGRVEAKETLFGKGALDAWAGAHLREGARDALEMWYRGALGQIRGAAEAVDGFVEVHSFGDLGSTYDMQAGGRPVRRPEAALIGGTPWASAYPVGLARLLPGDLRGTPWALEKAVTDALQHRGFRVGPGPYPTQGPWALSSRFLASRWFAWLAHSGQLPAQTGQTLVNLAWTDEQDPRLEAIASGQGEEPEDLRGVRQLARAMGAWSHDAGKLGDQFLSEAKAFTLVVELRNDRVADAEVFGAAVAEGLRGYLAGRG